MSRGKWVKVKKYVSFILVIAGLVSITLTYKGTKELTNIVKTHDRVESGQQSDTALNITSAIPSPCLQYLGIKAVVIEDTMNYLIQVDKGDEVDDSYIIQLSKNSNKGISSLATLCLDIKEAANDTDILEDEEFKASIELRMSDINRKFDRDIHRLFILSLLECYALVTILIKAIKSIVHIFRIYVKERKSKLEG